MRLLRRFLILSHRYLGLALGLVVITWFASGIVMIYTGGMPTLDPAERLARLPPLDFAAVRVTPSDAAARAGGRRAGRATLLTIEGRPAYRFAGARPATVFADTGEAMDELTIDRSKAVAARFLGVDPGGLGDGITLTAVDQWTISQSRQLPLHKFDVQDGDRSQVYVSPQSGEVILVTTRTGRALAWAGAIPHWFYVASLRTNPSLWSRVVVWTAAAACVLAVLGLLLGITQFRMQRPFRLSASIPYAGLMRWHYVTGVVFGLFTLTWAFSGLLSMEPFDWTNASGLEMRRDVFSGGPVDLARFGALDGSAWHRIAGDRSVKEIDFVRIQDEPYFIARVSGDAAGTARVRDSYGAGADDANARLLVSATTMEVRRDPFSVESLLTRLTSAVPDVPVRDHALLDEYDSYYYARNRQAPLPVLRVRFADPAETWFYIDPAMSQIVAESHRLGRIERWLYNGLHSLDFGFWYDRRPLWDIGVIVLLLGGLTSSVLGFYVGVRRLVRRL